MHMIFIFTTNQKKLLICLIFFNVLWRYINFKRKCKRKIQIMDTWSQSESMQAWREVRPILRLFCLRRVRTLRQVYEKNVEREEREEMRHGRVCGVGMWIRRKPEEDHSSPRDCCLHSTNHFYYTTWLS